MGLALKKTKLFIVCLILLSIILSGCTSNQNNSQTTNDKNAPVQNQDINVNAGTINYDPASNIGNKIADNTNPNPLHNLQINPFSESS